MRKKVVLMCVTILGTLAMATKVDAATNTDSQSSSIETKLAPTNVTKNQSLPMVAKGFDFSTWTPSSTSVINNFSLVGHAFSVETSNNAPFVANQIKEIDSGTNHTYSYSDDSGTTSRLYLYNNDISDTVTPNTYYSKVDSDGQKMSASCFESNGVQVVETFKNDNRWSPRTYSVHIKYVE